MRSIARFEPVGHATAGGAVSVMIVPWLVCCLLFTGPPARGQTAGAGGAKAPASAPAKSTTGSGAAPAAVLPPEKIDELVAPIALYPDVLISQILPASTFPLDIVKAARWLRAKPDMSKLTTQDWDLSVLALCNYPDVIYKMDQDLDWTNALGTAFLDQPKEMMAAIQRLRQKATQTGALQTNKEQTVVAEQETIRIVPSQSNVVYVPTYNPQTVYVVQDNSAAVAATAAAISFGAGLALGAWLNTDCDWHGGSVYYCKPGYWGGWGYHGKVAYGNDWMAAVGPRRGLVVGENGGIYRGPNGAAIWGDNGRGAAWARPVATPYNRPAYSGRYASYNNYRGNTAVANRQQAFSNNDINVNRNNVNIDRGDRNTAVRGGTNVGVGGNRTNIGGTGATPRPTPYSGAFSDRGSGADAVRASDRGQQSRTPSATQMPARGSQATQRPAAGTTARPSAGASPRPSNSGSTARPTSGSSSARSAFSNSGGSSQTRSYSNRGSASRSSGGMSRSGGGGGRGRR